MAEPLVDLSTCEIGLSLSPIPAWVCDEDIRFLWANDAALEFWRAKDRAELFARDVISEVPKPVRARMRRNVERCRAGERVCEEWIMYPGGVQLTVMLDVKLVALPSGAEGVLLQAQPIGGARSDTLERNIAMFRQSIVMLALVSEAGDIVAQNPAATTSFGEQASWLAWFDDPNEARRVLQQTWVAEQQSVRHVLPARVADGRLRWHVVESKTVRDPVTTQIVAQVEHLDVTAQVEAEQLAEARSATLALVERQRREILELSAPLLDVGDATVTVPIIGRFDRERAEALMTKLLEHVAARSVRRVILDWTGVAEFDPANVEHLRSLVAALRLLGAQVLLTGIQPNFAQALATAELELEHVQTFRSLAHGLGRR